MKEITGNLWDFECAQNTVICITTNGYVKANGDAVCGRGCALEAAERYPRFKTALGLYIRQHGNVAGHLHFSLMLGNIELFVFPVKHRWDEDADIELIRKSAAVLKESAEQNPNLRYILPRPGCGNGRLTWAYVKPALESLPDNVLVISFPEKP